MSRPGAVSKLISAATLFAVIALSLPGIRVSCGAAERSSAKRRINLVHEGSYGEVEVSFKEKGKRAGTIAFQMNENRGSFDAVVRRRGKEVGRFRDVFDGGLIGVEIGTVDLERDGTEVIFVGVESGGTGANNVYLNLLCPRKLQWIWLSLHFSYNATEAIPSIRISNNFHERTLRQEREFLIQLMYDYGYIGEVDVLKRADDPEFAHYFWERDNGSIQDGYMTLRKYKGKSRMGASVTAQVQDGDILYTGYFKAGVEAYDKRADEHWVVFHPYSMYSWPHELKKVGDELIVQCYDEGLAVVNTKTHHLKRISPDKLDEWLRKLQRQRTAALVVTALPNLTPMASRTSPMAGFIGFFVWGCAIVTPLALALASWRHHRRDLIASAALRPIEHLPAQGRETRPKKELFG